jgi:hypothetical protein
MPAPRMHGQRKVNILGKTIGGVMTFIAPVRRCSLSDDFFQKRGANLVGDAVGLGKGTGNVECEIHAPV